MAMTCTIPASRKTPLPITVALCTRDRPERLRRALASLAAQRPAPAEILVIDSAPTDGRTRAVAQATAGVAPGVRYLMEPVPGLESARNRALAAAGREIVAFLDDDAMADPGWAAAMLAPFVDSRVGAVTGRVEALDVAVRLPQDEHRPLHGLRVPRIAWAVGVGSGRSLAVRRRLLLALGGFDEALDLGAALPGGGDHDALWRLLEAGWEVHYEPSARTRQEHRWEEAAAWARIAGHQRALVAFLVKSLGRAKGSRRLSLLLFLLWRLAKPVVRLARRMVGRDPLPIRLLLRMAAACWSGLWAYPRARRAAQRRKSLPWAEAA